MVRTSVTHLAIMSHKTVFFLPHFAVICDLLLRTDARQHGIYLLIIFSTSTRLICIIFNRLIRKQTPNFHLSTAINFYLFEPKGSPPNPSPNPKLDVKPKLGMLANGSVGLILFTFPPLLLPGCSNFCVKI